MERMAARETAINRDAAEPADRLLDVDGTLTRFAGDQRLLREIAVVFVRTVPQLLTSIHAALASNDMKQLFHHAHSLKGAVAAFEAPAVLTSVMALESHAKESDTAAAASAFPAAHSLVERLMGELAGVVPSSA
jgi:HPt (histidine-containing phosphotransfer) domain-containing protein